MAIKEGSTGGLEYRLNNKDRAKFPFEGGIIDAPVVIYHEPPTLPPPRHKFVAGLDPYKQESSGTDSVGSTYILERKTDLNMPIEIIRASYASRPSPMAKFNRVCETLFLGYNAECMMEAADTTFLQYLEGRGNAHQVLAYGVDWSKFVNPSAKPNNYFGFYPTVKNNEYLFNLVLNYCWEKVVVGMDEHNIPIEKLGVEFIPDPGLLEEIVSYKKGENHDRIRAFGAALAWARWLDKLRVMPEREMTQEERQLQYEELRKTKIMNKGFSHLLVKKKPFV